MGMSPSIKNYSKPRPVWIMVIGDTLLYAGNATGFASLIGDSKTGAYIGFGVGVLAYFFSKLYTAIEKEIIRQETLTIETTVTKETDGTNSEGG